MNNIFKVEDKVRVIKTGSIGTIKEIRNDKFFEYPIKVHQFSIGYSDYKAEDLELVTDGQSIKTENESKIKILQIPVKFEKGDTLYTTKQVKEEKVCHICEGKKTITYNGKEMKCPECGGIGKFTSNKQVNVVIDEPYVIKSVKIALNSDFKVSSIKYKGRCGYQELNRAEENLFITKEEAQKRCDKLNKEKIYINISDIIIQDSFSQPSIEKITERLNYYKDHGKFEKEITVDKNNVLLDGYITYLLCKLLNINTVRAIVETPVIDKIL